MARINLRTSDTKKELFESFCERNGTNMSEELNQYIEETVGTTTPGKLPDQPELASAYKRLHSIRSDESRITVADAEPQLANELNIPTMAVRHQILDRLNDRGYINVRVGIITLNVDLEDYDDDC